MRILDALVRRELRVPALAHDGTVVLEARGVTVAYGPVRVLDDVDVQVRSGQVLALVGPNGAGKSTLLGVLAGDHAPQRGEVLVDGQPLGSWMTNELAVRRGVLLQQVDVTFPFTVTQVVRMGRAPWAGTPAEVWDDDVVADALIETDTGAFAERIYSTLSGGERQRAALARVLAQEPCALLLDEPTASLDIHHQEMVLGLARQRAARGDAVVVVLHDLGLAANHADVVAVLRGGRLVAAGDPAQVLTEDLLSEVYQHPIAVFPNPRNGNLVIEPLRPSRPKTRPIAPATEAQTVAPIDLTDTARHHGGDAP
jgi:iron complex transport system ATP-binding protein